MKKLGIVALVLVALAGLLYLKYPFGWWRYRMTVTVETPEGIKTGSAVREVNAHREPDVGENAGAGSYVRGEAVVVDLGARGTLFALLRGQNSVDHAEDIVFHMFPMPDGPGGGLTREGIWYYSRLKDAKATLPIDKYPMLVRFKDINDPKTVERVDPNNLAASFGDGVKLVSASIEITSDPVTTGVEKKLGWLREYYGKMLDGERYETIEAKNRLANSLGSGSFSTEVHYDNK